MSKTNFQVCKSTLSVSHNNGSLYITALPDKATDAEQLPRVAKRKMMVDITSKGVVAQDWVDQARSHKGEAIAVVPMLNGQLSVTKNGQLRLTMSSSPATKEEMAGLVGKWAQEFKRVLDYFATQGEEFEMVRRAQIHA